MQRTVVVESPNNGLAIALDGKQTFVKIYHADSNKLLGTSQSKGVQLIRQSVKPGRYRVEAGGSGKISEVRPIEMNMQGDEDMG